LFPSAFAGRAALSQAASLRTIPLRRGVCRVPDSAGGRTLWSRHRPCGFSALCASCARPTPRDCCHASHRFSPGHSPRSLFRAAFRYPLDRTLSQPGRACCKSLCIQSGNAHGISGALRSFPCPRFPAFLRFVPTCRYPNRSRASPLIFTGCRSPLCKTPSEERVPKWDRRREPSNRLLGHAAANKLSRARSTIERATGQSCLGLLGASLGCVGCFFTARVCRACSSSSWC